MHIHFLDPYQPLLSPIHRLDGRIKFVLTVAFILTTSLTPVAAWPVYILLLAVILAVEILSALGIKYVLKRSILALPFVLAALPVIFTIKGQPIFELSISTWTLTATFEGLSRFVSVAFKSWLSVQAAIVLSASTQFPELLQAMRAVGIPRLLVGMFGLTWRYLFVLVDEALRLMRARTARSGHANQVDRKPGGSLAWRARMAGGMAGNLFLRAFERSDRIYVAMLSRGYDGEVRTLPLPSLSSMNWSILLISLSFFGILLIFGNLLWG
jgi:cobalt/nickel transport system permease protein